jgi:hypothetical protein
VATIDIDLKFAPEQRRLLALFAEASLEQWGRYPAVEWSDVETALRSLIAGHE